MLLSVLERGLISNVLPGEGNLFTMRLVHNLRMELSFSEEELAIMQLRPTADGLGTMWDDGVEPKEIEIGEKAKEIILDGLREMDKNEKLTESYLPICERFGYEGEEE